MNILIAGASGFIGTELVKNLSQNHNITVLGRNLAKLEKSFGPGITKITFGNLNHHDAKNYNLVINLSGSNIAAKRWTPSVKKELIESRTLTNQHLIEWMINQNAKPRFFCANAIGIYGAEYSSNEYFSENSSISRASNDFSSQICLAWEDSLQKALDASIPVTTLRFGVVLKKGCGMLQKLELPFRIGLGSILGAGQQGFSWIHHQDLVNAVTFLIDHPHITGPVNITSPTPITQEEFAKNFAQILDRNLFFNTPSWFIKLLFGEMGEYLLLKGQKVIPSRLTEAGFRFIYPDIRDAIALEYK